VQVHNFKLELYAHFARVNNRVLQLDKLALDFSSSLFEELQDVLFPEVPGDFPHAFSLRELKLQLDLLIDSGELLS
jgi:hypothetical protein